jgi:hypothetical protein
MVGKIVKMRGGSRKGGGAGVGVLMMVFIGKKELCLLVM